MTRPKLCFYVALALYTVAMLISLNAFDGNYPAFIAGGSMAFVAAHLP